MWINITITIFCWSYFLKTFKRESFYSPLFWYLLFHSYVFLVRPMLAYAYEFYDVWDYMNISPDKDLIEFGYIIASVGLISFIIGYDLSYRRSDVNKIQVGAPSLLATKIIWSTLGSIAIYSAIFTGQSAAGGNENIITDRIGGVAINVNQNGYLLDAQFMLVGLCALLAVKLNFSFISLMPALIFFTYRSYIGWGRWSIILTALALYMLYLSHQEKKWPRASFVMASFAAYLLFNMLGENRNVFKNLISGEESTLPSVSIDTIVYGLVGGLDFANMEYLCYILKYVPDASTGFTFGLQHLQVLTEPIPRILWQGKPVGPPFAFYNLNDFGNFNGLTTSVIGDGWISGGLIGVVVTMLLIGYLLGRAYVKFQNNFSSTKTRLLYLAFAAMYIQLYRDGSLVSLIKFSAFALLPIYFSYKLDHYLQKSFYSSTTKN